MRFVRSAMGMSLGLLWCLSGNVRAVEGFPAALGILHPELKPDCTTCHDLARGESPSNLNVKAEGRAYYQELMVHEQTKNKALPTYADYFEATDFVVYGDTRTQDNIHREIVQLICAENPSFAVHTGDMVADGGNANQWKNALAIEACLIQDKKLIHACGNHEGSHCTKNVIRDALQNFDAFYAVERDGFTFLVLDANNISKEQIAWLKAKPVGPKYIPVYHQAPYPTMSGHGSENGIVQNFVPEFKRLGVKVAFNGHNHGYDRALVDGIQYVTVGGGGAPLYPCGSKKSYTQICSSDYTYARCSIADNQIDCSTKRRDSSVIDQFSILY